MCWSAPVSLSFAALQFCVLAGLFWRNKHYDRVSVLALAPIMVQEFGQGMTWLFVANPDVCSRGNAAWTFFTCLWIASVPTFVSFTCYLVTDGEYSVRRLAMTCFCSSWFLMFCLNANLRFFSDRSVCSSRGTCGHLVLFPADEPPNVPGLAGYLGSFCVSALLIRCNDGRNNWWAYTGFAFGMGSCGVVYLWMWLRSCDWREWGSVWCWTNSTLCLWLLIEVEVYRWCVDATWQPPAKPSADSKTGAPAGFLAVETDIPLAA
eukprot:TRINITY_DN32423_c0_g1_i1.p1 TRINITY_DN32423_c0_g1~~TRINITY_DN32423_c0_g1_i1.p1  ORF type:complete len:263 (-),score=8.58 TRINITY_DN32423_c0_g1_i1:299-1087(-)